MSWSWRRSKKLGPFRFTFSKRGVSGSVGAGGVRASRSTTGRRSVSVGLPWGLRWLKSWRRR